MTVETIEIHEIRKLLVAIETIAVRPAQCNENTIGEALGYFKKLMLARTNGQISIAVVVDGVVLND